MGGFSPPPPPAVSAVKCNTDDGYGCFRTYKVQPEGAIKVTGTNFSVGAQIVFRGSPNPSDDTTVPADLNSPTELTAPVPKSATSGPVVVINPDGQESNPSRAIAIGKLPRRTLGPGPTLQGVAVSPHHFFYGAQRQAALTIQIQEGGPSVDRATVELVRVDSGSMVRTWFLEHVPAGTPVSVRWDGTDGTGRVLPEGRYAFRFAISDGQGRQTTHTTARSAKRHAKKLKRAAGTILFHKNAFPVQGKYDLNGFGANGRFGAGRGGRSHQGQDVPAACGTPLIAVESGTIRWKDSHPLAGNYIVLSGYSKSDYAYMHLRDPALVESGATVTTGQLLGYVGQSGDASACHLHFELWQGGWQSGGHPIDPLPFLKRLASAK